MDELKDDKHLCCSCHGEHWTSKCPWKGISLEKNNPDDKNALRVAAADHSMQDSKNLTPNVRDDVKKTNKPCKPNWSIRIDNLSPSTTEIDLAELIKPFGLIQKRYLAKDKATNLCEGFAYVRFKCQDDAVQAISVLNEYTYDNCILSADWSERSSCQIKEKY